MGTLFRKGTRSMSDLIVAHVIESVNVQELKLFKKLINRSKISSNFDILFVLPKNSFFLKTPLLKKTSRF
uniref:DUF7780 domain-containing protein n=1 Tax=Solanum lycopersicum TaxID=4081 RepID=A0A3Q7ICN3_SOLLC